MVSRQTLFSDLLLGLQCPGDPVLLYKLTQVIFQPLSHLFVLTYKMQNVQVCHLCSFFFSLFSLLQITLQHLLSLACFHDCYTKI